MGSNASSSTLLQETVVCCDKHLLSIYSNHLKFSLQGLRIFQDHLHQDSLPKHGDGKM